MTLFRLSDFANRYDALRNLQNMMDDFWGELSPFYKGNFTTGRNVFPPVNIFEQGDDQIVIKCELAGMKKEDIDILIKEKMITISGKRENNLDNDKDLSYHRKERPFGKFNRTFELPYLVNNEKSSAEYEKGILTITLEKAEEAKSKKIAIS